MPGRDGSGRLVLRPGRRVEYKFLWTGRWRWCGGRVLWVRGEWAKVAFDNGNRAESWTRTVKASEENHGEVWRQEREQAPKQPKAKAKKGRERVGAADGPAPARAEERATMAWTDEADRRLLALVQSQGPGDWARKAAALGCARAPSPEQACERWQGLFKQQLLSARSWGDEARVQRGGRAHDAVVRCDGSTAWVQFKGEGPEHGGPTEEFLTKDELRARAPDWARLDSTACEICQRSDDEARLMLCDGCGLGFHSTCFGLRALPAGDWYCSAPACQRQSQPAVAKGDTVDYLFVERGQERWYSGVVSGANRRWSGWFSVRFESEVRKSD